MSKSDKRIVILTEDELRKTLSRLTSEIIEKVQNLDNLLLVGIPTRGIDLAEVLEKELFCMTGLKIKKGIIDMPDENKSIETSSLVQDDTNLEIRSSVAKLCQDFQGEYWRNLDREQAYPTEFVQSLTHSGFLSVLIPEQYGGSGLGITSASVILEEIHHQGCNAAACHAQMYTMGTVLRHGSDEQKKSYLPEIASGKLRLQAFGVTEPTSGTDTTSLRTTATKDGDDYIINGQKIWTSRAEHSDLMLLLARTKPLSEVSKKTDGLSVFCLLYTSPSPRDLSTSRMPSSA